VAKNEVLAEFSREIADYARGYGLDFYTTVFEELDFDELNQVAAYGGFPTRYPHWSFGMDYEHLSKGYEYGLSKIYELVINNDPCYAYLMKSNGLTDQKLVMAHVYAHCDFFKNNIWFSKTNRRMMDEMANHGSRVRKYVDEIGFEVVESFMDRCLSINNLIDSHSVFIQRETLEPEGKGRGKGLKVPKLKSKPYMDRYINPKEYIDAEKERIEKKMGEHQGKFPKEPVKDILEFLLRYAPLDRWQRDILSMIREEAYYFAPQGQTKIMNEGWASYWHSTIMPEKVLNDSEIIDYADHHSGTVAMRPGSINPYKVGLELFRDIEDRWNKGRFGKEYEECENLVEKAEWDKKLGLGRQKIFDVRRIYNDITFIDTFFTAEFCREYKLFAYSYNYRTGQYEISDRDFNVIKQKLLFGLTNMGQPLIYVTDSNWQNRGELYLQHYHEGIDLRLDWARDTLTNLQAMWKRPVNLETIIEGRHKILTYDGKAHGETDFDKRSSS
jgi:stage V sporulation protein R